MEEMILFIMAAFLGGWGIGGLFNRRISRSQHLEDPEMMWFNKQKSQWERITEMHLYVADRAVVVIPVKLVEQSNNIN